MDVVILNRHISVGDYEVENSTETQTISWPHP